MINSLCGSMGSLKSENSSTKAPPSSPTESISECKRSVVTPSSVLEETGLNLPNIKFELEGDVEVPSPTSSALWESFLTDQLDVDFMICSPVRNFPSPQASTYNYNYNYAHAMHGQSLSGSSPPRVSSTPIGAYSSINKGKGISPLHKVFNSPNNQYMKAESLAALSSMEEFLNDGSEYEAYSMTKLSSMGSSTHGFDMPVMVPEVDTLGMSDASTFSGSLTGSSTAVGSRLTPESEVYDQLSSVSSAPLSQQLQQERLQEKQPQQQTAEPLLQNLNHHMTVPLPLSSEQEADSGLELVHLLLACAEAVAKEEYMLARKYIHHLNRVVTPLGDSMQRVAACFTEALSARLAATLTSTTKPGTSSPKPFSPFPPNQLEILKIFQIVYQACPYIKFAHFTANQAIFEAFEAEERVHVIDLDILEGYQWPAFMQALAARPGGAPFLRITGVGNSMECLKETGRCLSQLAHSLHIPFEFHPVNEELEDLKPYMFNRRVGEALAVNSVNRLHRVVGSCLGSLLAMIRDQAPNILTLVEQEASHNGPYFLGRFLEALHYYSAIFDSLAATFPTESTQRMKVEQYIFAPEIRNIVACEGIERTERHERLEKWRKIMESKGFKGVSLSANAVTQSKILLSLYSCEGYKLTEDGGCLLLGWQDRALIAASAWRC